MRTSNNIINKNITKIIYIFLFMQPLLDVIAGISINQFNCNITINSIIRLSFILFCIYYLLILNNTENKQKNKKIIIYIFSYIFLYSIITIIYKDINILPYELKQTINTFYLPITLITFIDMFKQYNINFKLNYIIYIYITYITFILLPNLTNTSFQSYSHSKLGNIGWFQSANSIGNILSILLPIIIIFLFKYKTKKYIKIILILLTLYSLVSIGTKVPILSLVICTIITFIHFLANWIKEKNIKNIIKLSIISSIIIIFSIILVPKTSFYKNIEIHKNYLGIENYLELLTEYELIDHFIFSQRLTFLKNTHNNFKKVSIPEKFFGIGYIENYKTEFENSKTIEIDYCEIFYRSGIIGFILYFKTIIPIINKTLKKLKNKTFTNLQFKTSIILIALLALFAGHILITPAVSIYVALILTIPLKGGFNEEIN